MARRATIIKNVREAREHVLILDAGDFYPSGGVGSPGRTASFLSRVYGTWGRTIIGVGEYDLNFGAEFLKKNARENGLRIVNANIVSKDSGKRLFEPYIIEKVEWARVGIVSIIGNDIRLNLPDEENEAYEVLPAGNVVLEVLE